MTYQEAIDFLFTSLPVFQRVGGSAYKANLDSTNRLDAYFGHPHRKFHTIHVAGTNGKGSTSHMLAAILQTAGYRTGLYTSPHLLDFRERIKINGEMIPEQDVVDFVDHHHSVIQEIQPSFFEMSVAMALDHFARERVDVAVIEVGMGGRLDSTNIITPLLSIITNISHDHGQFLGDTLEKIAREKGGIIKENIPVVIGESQPETRWIFQRLAEQHHSLIFFADSMYTTGKIREDISGQIIVLEDTKNKTSKEYHLDLSGIYQQNNLKTVLASIDVLVRQGVLVIPENAVRKGISQASRLTGLHGRWQVLSENPLIVADTGHNEAGIRQIMNQIGHTPFNKLYLIFGVVNDKELDKIWPLLPRQAYYIFTQARIERALDACQLGRQAAERGFTGEIISDISSAVSKAKELAGENDMIFIGGSTFTVAEALPLFPIK